MRASGSRPSSPPCRRRARRIRRCRGVPASGDSANSFPGLLAAPTMRPEGSRSSAVTCRAVARASSVARAGSPLTRKILPSVPVPTSRLPSGSITQVVRRVLAGVPDRVPEAVGPDAIDRAAAGAPASSAPIAVRASAATGPVDDRRSPVISVDTVGTGGRGGSVAVGGSVARLSPAASAVHGRRVDRPVVGDAQRRGSRGTASRAARTPCRPRRSGRRARAIRCRRCSSPFA